MSGRSATATLAVILLTAGWAQGDTGIAFTGASSVSEKAIQRARYVVDQMLLNIPAVRAEMSSVGFKVEIIGIDQVLSDLPDYAALKGRRTRDGRDFDRGTRGVGDKLKCSVGEENLLCLSKQMYPQEDVLVHEFSHSIHRHLSPELARRIDGAYQAAMKEDLYPKEAYMARDSGEYWAEGTQAWFNVTLRTDVNGGINTREKLQGHDSRLASILAEVYGPTFLARYPGCKY
jgi:hypothetical protein